MRGLVVMVSTMVLLTGCMGEPVFHGEVLPAAQAQDFTLEDDEGLLWTLTAIEADVIILVFMFTECTETCPVVSASMAEVVNRFTEEESERIQVLSITLDVERDSPSVLHNWTEQRGYAWPHLTGSPTALRTGLGCLSGRSDPLRERDLRSTDMAHPQPTFLLDGEHRGWRVVHDGYDWPISHMLDDVRTLMRRRLADARTSRG